MDNQKEKDIKYKISEGNKNSILNTANYASNIKTEDDLLSQLEQLKSENRYEECITLIEQQLPSLEKNYSTITFIRKKLFKRTRKILSISLRNN